MLVVVVDGVIVAGVIVVVVIVVVVITSCQEKNYQMTVPNEKLSNG